MQNEPYQNLVETAVLFFDYVCNNGLDIEKLREGADGHEGAVATYRKMKATIYKMILKIVPKRIKT